jgi:hypothetical protein
MTVCFSLPDCFSACKTTQDLPVTKLAKHVDLFHLVITDNQIPEISLPPPWLAPYYKAHYTFSAKPPHSEPKKSDGPAVWFL